MNATDTVVNAADLLKEHEEAIGRLYAAYARRFPQDAGFWRGLAREESQHARWVASLRSRFDEDVSGLVVERFPAVAIQRSLAYVHKLTDLADWPGLTRINALSAALDIERALLESRYFEIFESDSARVKRTLDLLARNTRTHLDRVQSAWEAATHKQRSID